jgi:5-histidylcysteine sulfoxide synthase/putative 4-mercaptohistidine N1-methyltranferase
MKAIQKPKIFPQPAKREPGAEDLALLKTRTPRLDGKDPEAKRAEILKYFHDTFTLYERLFECLKDDAAFTAVANPLRHPLIFYFGHTSVFFVNKLNVAGFINERLDPHLESQFSVGVDEMSWDDLGKPRGDWPAPAAVLDYRRKTRALVDRFIRSCSVTLPIAWNDPLWIVLMGIEHERIHLETSAVLMRELPLQHLRPHPLWSRLCPERGVAPVNELLPVAGGPAILGKRDTPALYGWDNEYGRQESEVKSFRASKYLVSNREFLSFVEGGGYAERRYWTEEGWNWAVYKKAAHPAFWVKEGEGYRYRAMLEIIDMPWNWPVDVNYLEAKAFCNWKAEKTGKKIRLPSEAEWHRLRELVSEDQPDWKQAPGNINLERYMSACPVNTFVFAGGFYDIIGNAWQWTETPIDGFEGFKVHPAYDDFSTPTFDGKHNIFKGGCWISTGNYAIRDSRYAFRRHFLQNSGIRYVEGEALAEETPNIYETDAMVSQYIEFHYGDEHFGVPNYPKACAQLCLEYMKGLKTERALDLGCATGRSSFELARAFGHVDAVDFSARLIQMPSRLQQLGRQRYVVQDEGELVSFKEVTAEDLKLGEALQRVSFMQGDACNLAAKYTDYDLVFAGNLIDRLYDPAKFLALIGERLHPGGLLVLTSPYTWLEDFTARAKWLGGFKAKTGENFTTLDGLKAALGEGFALVATRDVPFVIRETRRKFQHTVSEMSVWRKK